jgi:hypothetical protein
MTTINNGCKSLYHEGHIPMCFVYGTPCIYKDREGCEKARILDIRELARVVGNHSVPSGVERRVLEADYTTTGGATPLNATKEERAK